LETKLNIENKGSQRIKSIIKADCIKEAT